ncbi:MAG: hypothetical protein J2P47_17250, partial [Acetobacteraceae bacterium]|nr:hypothetical protein [Acetobacteraceae bacterium]
GASLPSSTEPLVLSLQRDVSQLDALDWIEQVAHATFKVWKESADRIRRRAVERAGLAQV